jgi:hypothetical protein
VQRAGGHDVVTNECDCNGFNSSGISDAIRGSRSS